MLHAAVINNLEKMLSRIGHDPHDAAAGWRSKDPLVVATLFAALGYPVFPCNKFKVPLVRHGVNDATCHLFALQYWAREKAIYGWCVKTGRYEEAGGPPGLWILDIDGPAGYAWLAELEKILGPLPQNTWATASGREESGEHRIYAPAADGPDMKTVGGAMILGKRGKIDQRGRGGYAVIAGSLHKSGIRYRWKDGCAPDEVPLAQLPPAWVEAIDKVSAAPGSTIRRERRTPPPSSICSAREVCATDGITFGDGPGGGGFHGPIYRLANKLLREAGSDLSTQTVVKILRIKVLEAPFSPDRDPADITRYASENYLIEQVGSARRWCAEHGF